MTAPKNLRFQPSGGFPAFHEDHGSPAACRYILASMLRRWRREGAAVSGSRGVFRVAAQDFTGAVYAPARG